MSGPVKSLDEAMERIASDAQARMQARIGSAERYATHLLDGGDPARTLECKDADAIFYGWQVERGERPCVYGPLNPYAFAMERRLRATFGEWVTATELQDVTPTSHRPQIEATIKQHTLRQHGCDLEKGKLGGKVAYRLVEWPCVEGARVRVTATGQEGTITSVRIGGRVNVALDGETYERAYDMPNFLTDEVEVLADVTA